MIQINLRATHLRKKQKWSADWLFVLIIAAATMDFCYLLEKNYIAPWSGLIMPIVILIGYGVIVTVRGYRSTLKRDSRLIRMQKAELLYAFLIWFFAAKAAHGLARSVTVIEVMAILVLYSIASAFTLLFLTRRHHLV